MDLDLCQSEDSIRMLFKIQIFSILFRLKLNQIHTYLPIHAVRLSLSEPELL